MTIKHTASLCHILNVVCMHIVVCNWAYMQCHWIESWSNFPWHTAFSATQTNALLVNLENKFLKRQIFYYFNVRFAQFPIKWICNAFKNNFNVHFKSITYRNRCFVTVAMVWWEIWLSLYLCLLKKAVKRHNSIVANVHGAGNEMEYSFCRTMHHSKWPWFFVKVKC